MPVTYSAARGWRMTAEDLRPGRPHKETAGSAIMMEAMSWNRAVIWRGRGSVISPNFMIMEPFRDPATRDRRPATGSRLGG